MEKNGFTLIELSIVLVIIGLIVGGVLVGQYLIRAAAVRAQISQIEKYNTAVNTFYGKYGYLPGDMNANAASQFGFVIGDFCDGTQGHRDGNGLIDGYTAPALDAEAMGETGLFWQDLGSASLIGETITGITCFTWPSVSGTALNAYFPAAKIGAGNYVYVYDYDSTNWFGLSAITSVGGGGSVESDNTITVIQAYGIDSKIDDGLPLTGNVQAAFLSYTNNQSAQNPPNRDAASNPSDTPATCFVGNYESFPNLTDHYSISINNGAGANCALSFRFQ